MEITTPKLVDIPTALPGFEDDQVREKLLLETNDTDPNGEADEEELDLVSEPTKPKTRRFRVLRTLLAFGAFVFFLAIAVSWFFGMGWFAEKKSQPISRNASKEGQTPPATEDEKLKMALSMIAAPPSPTKAATDPTDTAASDERPPGKESPELSTDSTIPPLVSGIDQGQKTSAKESFSLPSRGENVSDDTLENSPKGRSPSVTAKINESDEARGRSLFFGVSKKPAKADELRKSEVAETTKVQSAEPIAPTQIPFGTLLPVRLMGSIYTLRNAGGFARMELTRPVEGNGYFYPAGTIIIGDVRGGESVRAFVTILGLIDPASGLVRFSGELLGTDGGSGIQGRRRNLTSQWARVFSGLKDSAASILGSLGAIRSGGTVVLSEPIRRSSESVTGDLSNALLRNERETTFLEVSAGASGYVLVTALPENAAAATSKPKTEAAKE